MSDTGKKRLIFVTIAQVFSMLLIVLSHSVPMGVDGWMMDIVPYIQRCGLTVFMTLSGFLVSHTKQIEKYGYRGFVFRRTVRLLVPYGVVSAVMLFPKFLVGKMTGVAVSVRLTDILYQLIAPRQGIQPHLWFLVTLWVLCLFVPLFKMALSRKWSAAVLMAATLILHFLPKTVAVLAIGDAQRYAFWFCLGLLLGKKWEGIRISMPWTAAGWIASAAIGAGYYLLRLLGAPRDYIYFLYSMFCLLVVLMLARCTENVLGKSCAALGRYSLTIYILSLPVQNIMDIVLNQLGVPALPAYGILFLAGLVVPVGIAAAAEAIDRKIGRKCIGTMIGL